MEEVRKEQGKAEEYIITSCFTLLAALAIIFSIKQPANQLVSYAVILSFFGLLVSLLELLWHKSRRPLREHIFNQKRGSIIDKYSEKMATFAETLVFPYAKLAVEEEARKNINIDKKALQRKLFHEKEPAVRDMLTSYLDNLIAEMKNASDVSHNKPIIEKYSRLKLYLDVVSRRTRLHFFVVGTLFFFIAIILSLL